MTRRLRVLTIYSYVLFRRYTKGVPFLKKWYIKGQDFGAEPPHIKLFLSTPGHNCICKGVSTKETVGCIREGRRETGETLTTSAMFLNFAVSNWLSFLATLYLFIHLFIYLLIFHFFYFCRLFINGFLSETIFCSFANAFFKKPPNELRSRCIK